MPAPIIHLSSGDNGTSAQQMNENITNAQKILAMALLTAIKSTPVDEDIIPPAPNIFEDSEDEEEDNGADPCDAALMFKQKIYRSAVRYVEDINGHVKGIDNETITLSNDIKTKIKHNNAITIDDLFKALIDVKKVSKPHQALAMLSPIERYISQILPEPRMPGIREHGSLAALSQYQKEKCSILAVQSEEFRTYRAQQFTLLHTQQITFFKTTSALRAARKNMPEGAVEIMNLEKQTRHLEKNVKQHQSNLIKPEEELRAKTRMVRENGPQGIIENEYKAFDLWKERDDIKALAFRG